MGEAVSGRRAISIGVAVLALCMLPLSAHGHDGHDAVLLQSDSVAGPFVVSVWAVGHSAHVYDVLVVPRGDVRPRAVDVIDEDGRSFELLPVADEGTWTGAVSGLSEGESLQIHLIGDGGREGSLFVSLPDPATPVMSLIVLVLLAQAMVTLAWLLLRWPAVWGRPRADNPRALESTVLS